MQLQPIKDEDSFQRDIETGAIVNTDNEALNAYKKRKQHLKTVNQDIQNLKSEISEIKSMLVSLMEKDK